MTDTYAVRVAVSRKLNGMDYRVGVYTTAYVGVSRDIALLQAKNDLQKHKPELFDGGQKRRYETIPLPRESGVGKWYTLDRKEW